MRLPDAVILHTGSLVLTAERIQKLAMRNDVVQKQASTRSRFENGN